MMPRNFSRLSSSSQSDNYITLTLLTLIGAFAYYISYVQYGMIQVDEGIFLDFSIRMMRGREWFVDFFPPYGPLNFLPLSGIFSITEPSFFFFRLFYILFRLCGLWAMISVSRRLMPSKWAVLAILPVIIAPGHLFKSVFLLMPMLILWLVFRAWESRRMFWLFVTGLAAGISLYFRYEMIFPLSVIALLGLELDHFRRHFKHHERWIRRLISITGVFAGLMLPAFFFPGAVNAPNILGRAFFGGKIPALGVPWPGFPTTHSPDQTATFLVLWGVLAIYAGVGADILRTLFRARSYPAWEHRLLVLVAGTLFLYNVLFQSNLGHMLQVSAPAFLLLADIGRRAVVYGKNTIMKIASGAVLAGILAAFLIYAVFLTNLPGVAGIALRRMMDTPITSPLGTVYFHGPRAGQIQSTINYIMSHTEPDDPVLVVPRATLISIMSERPNLNPYDTVETFPTFVSGWKTVNDFFKAITKSELIVYFERPTRLERPRAPHQRMRSNDFIFETILRNYTFEKRFGEYIILRKGKDETGATRAFIDGWEAYKYGHWEKAEGSLKKAVEAGLSESEIRPILKNIKHFKSLGLSRPPQL